jgi:UDP-galactopyranose mutase
MKKKYNIIIVGAGISGAVLADKYARQLNQKVTVLEKRNHIGGNCYDYKNEDGILVSKYGPHYFRTNDEEVWKYLQDFSEWVPFEAHCLSHVDGKKVPVPVNIDTVNILFGTKIEDEAGMKEWLKNEVSDIEEPKNSEESALKRVGKTLYEKMFKNYTEKQWDKHPTELEPSVMDRIPVRYNHDSRYFTDTHQAYPKEGYTRIFEKIFDHPNIEVVLDTTWEQFSSDNNPEFDKLFFCGKIDSYFQEELGKLEYRSLRFEEETLDQEFFQETVQENYPETSIPFTRIVEYKHQTKQKSPKTTIVREYPTWEGEPYYPVPSEKNREIYNRYQEKTLELEKKNIYFVGRLANYKYFNMDQAFKNALDLFKRLESGNTN